MNTKFTVIGDVIHFDGEPVGTLTIPEGSLRGRVVEQLETADDVYEAGREEGYKEGRKDGYGDGFADGREARGG